MKKGFISMSVVYAFLLIFMLLLTTLLATYDNSTNFKNTISDDTKNYLKEFILATGNDININYSYAGLSEDILPYSSYLNGLGTIYDSIVTCEGATATMNSDGVVNFTLSTLPESCLVSYNIALNKEISLSNLINADKVTINHTFNGSSTSTSLNNYISSLGTNYQANAISCSSGTSASISENGNVTFTAVSLPMTCTVDFTEGMPTYIVESPIDGSSYKFALNSNGYYESNNKGVANSAALAKVTITNYKTTSVTATFTLINYAESNYDYGLFSNIDTKLSTSYTADSSNVYKSYSGIQSASPTTLTYQIPSGTHYIYVKYRKDGSVNSNNDSLQFKISF